MKTEELEKKRKAYIEYLLSPKGRAEAILDQLEEARLKKLGYVRVAQNTKRHI